MLPEPVGISALASLSKSYGKRKALYDGRRMHAHICRYRYDSNTYLGNCLVEMYGNCGTPEDALATFDKISDANLYSWNLLIKAYGQNGNLEDATNTFGRMPCRDIVSWNAIITAFGQNGHGEEVLHLFKLMQHNQTKPDEITFVCALNACASLAAIAEGQEIHVAIVKKGYEQNVVIGTALIDMYGKCGHPFDATATFDKMSQRDIVCWTAMTTAFARNGHCKEALNLFHGMQFEGLEPNKVSFICVLDACATFAALEEGQKIHSAIVENGYEQDIVVANTLINMYAKCNHLCEAMSVFDSIVSRDDVSWNAMLAAFAQNGHGKEAVDLFYQMQLEGMKCDKVTFLSALDASASLAALHKGQKIHVALVASGYEPEIAVGNTLINMYGKCRCLHFARMVFDRMLDRDAVSWNTMIAASTQNGHGYEALNLFHQMQSKNAIPNAITLMCVLDACADMATFVHGQELHVDVINYGYEQDVGVGNALINMYGKCGSLCHAMSVFHRMAHRDVISWNAMIAAFAQNGHGKEALDFFHQMQLQGIKPSEVTSLCVLRACSHTGQVDDGRCVFDFMHRDDGLTHSEDNIVCMIELLGRAGHLDEAENLIKCLSFQKVAVAWWCVLVASRIHCDVERGKRAASHCFELEPGNAGVYVMLSNIYAASGRQDDAENMRNDFDESGVSKQQGGYHFVYTKTL